MTISAKRTKKEKKTIRAGLKLPLYCPKCKTPIPQSIYTREDMGLNYQCVMCGTHCFKELKKIIEENKDLKLT